MNSKALEIRMNEVARSHLDLQNQRISYRLCTLLRNFIVQQMNVLVLDIR